MQEKLRQFWLFLRTNKLQILTVVLTVAVISLIELGAWTHTQLVRMHKQIQNHEWRIPSTVYADPPVLFPGTGATLEWCVDYLEGLKYTPTNEIVLKPGQYSVREEGLVYFSRQTHPQLEKSPVLIRFNKKGVEKLVELKTGQELRNATLEPVTLAELYNQRWEKQKLLKLQDLPPHIPSAVLAIEDRRFYEHSGVDPKAIFRAAGHNIFNGGRLQGGSTITQQVVKNFFLTHKKSFRRKAVEAVMALMMERRFSKQTILEFYLNDVYMGKYGSMNVRGFEEASRLYFNKDARYMNLQEAALLAGMIQAPLRYDPYTKPEKAKQRRNTVLLAMRNTGAITNEKYQELIDAPVEVMPVDKKFMQAPYFVHAVVRHLSDRYPESEVRTGGYKIYTTLDIAMQRIAEESLQEGLNRIDKIRMKKTKQHVQGCLIAVEAATGDIVAFVGGRSFSDSQFDRVTQARRQPGSSFKPFVYAAAIESAYDPTVPYYTPATLIQDEPFTVRLRHDVWEPDNYNDQYHGLVTAREALAKSMNIATARLAQDFGLEKIVKLSAKLGLKNAKPYPSLSLGAFEVTPYDLITAYTAFPNNGTRVQLNPVRIISNAKDKIVHKAQLSKQSILREQTAYIITDMLKSVVTSGTGAGVQKYGLNGGIAGKTGTSNDKRDAWFIGFTPQLICLVWVGYDDNTPVGLTGGEAALPIWASFMKKVLPSYSNADFNKPSQTVERMIDPTTGKLASTYCLETVQEIFIQGTEPSEVCTYEDHGLPPESFAGPKLRYASTRTNFHIDQQPSQLDQEIYDAPVESVNEAESPNGFIYIAAPEKDDWEDNDDDSPEF